MHISKGKNEYGIITLFARSMGSINASIGMLNKSVNNNVNTILNINKINFK